MEEKEMNKLISLELKRNSLRSYHTAALISAVCLLALLYLFAAIPKLDGTETGLDMFMTYRSLIGITNIIGMVIFAVLSAVMSARFIVEEYAGKRAVLLFSYPVARRSIISSKIGMVFFYTAAAMFLCGVIVYGIFFATESMLPLCAEPLSAETIVYSLFSLICYSLLAGIMGIIALWFGFGRHSVTVTIVAAVIIAVISCQIMAMTMTSLAASLLFLAAGGIIAVIVIKNLIDQVEKMEV